jgi:predicted translin family RNA/ssDNA-binding protein
MINPNDRLLADVGRVISALESPDVDELKDAEDELASAREELQEHMANFESVYTNIVDAVDHFVDCVDRVAATRNPR